MANSAIPVVPLLALAALGFWYASKKGEDVATVQWVDHGIHFQWMTKTHDLRAMYTDPITGMFRIRLVGNFPTQSKAHQASLGWLPGGQSTP